MAKLSPMFAPAAMLCLLVFVFAGCSQAPTPIELDTAGVKPAVDYSDLKGVLGKCVSGDGRVILSALKDNDVQAALDRQLKLLAVTGPTATPALLPTRPDRLAYWCNAQAAWGLKLALVCDCPRQLERTGPLLDRPFRIDGRQMTLSQIDDLLAADEDWRVPVASPSVCLNRPGLPGSPFTAENVLPRVTERLGTYIDDDQRFVIDIDARTVIVPQVLWRVRGRIIEDHNRLYHTQDATLITALMPYVSGSPRRRLVDAMGYTPQPAQGAIKLAYAKEN